MTKTEMLKILETVSLAYPNTKIKDASKMADSYLLVLGDFNAEAVGKAARLYMSENTAFFPSAGELKERIVRASLVYGQATVTAIEPPKAEKRREDYYLEELCKFVGLGYEEPDDNADLLCDWLDFEK